MRRWVWVLALVAFGAGAFVVLREGGEHAPDSGVRGSVPGRDRTLRDETRDVNSTAALPAEEGRGVAAERGTDERREGKPRAEEEWADAPLVTYEEEARLRPYVDAVMQGIRASARPELPGCFDLWQMPANAPVPLELELALRVVSHEGIGRIEGVELLSSNIAMPEVVACYGERLEGVEFSVPRESPPRARVKRRLLHYPQVEEEVPPGGPLVAVMTVGDGGECAVPRKGRAAGVVKSGGGVGTVRS